MFRGSTLSRGHLRAARDIRSPNCVGNVAYDSGPAPLVVALLRSSYVHAMEDVDLQPTLVGPRVIVRPIAPADWPQMFAAAADPAIWTQHPASDRYTEPVFRAFFD